MKMDYRFMLSLFHLLFVVPLFLGVGFFRSQIPYWLYHLILIIGISIALYHGYRLLMRMRKGSNYAWVNAFHLLLVAPLLIYIGIKKYDTPRAAYELLLISGFGAAGYHLYNIINNLNTESQ
jgi:hypothetical protein